MEVSWIKIDTGIFDNEKIRLIEAMPNGDSILVIWFKMLALAGKQNNDGVFTLCGISYSEEMLASVFQKNVLLVRQAIEVFEKLGMVERISGALALKNWGKYQSVDALDRKREYDRQYQKIRYERRKQALLGNSDSPTEDQILARESNENRASLVKQNKKEDIREKKEEIREEIKEKEIKKKRQAKPAEPAVYFKNDEKLNEAFLAFIADRKERRKPMSSRAIKMAVDKLNELSGGDNDLAIKIINKSIEKGWMSFYALKDDNGRYQKSSSRDEWAEIFEEARREDMNEQRGSSEDSIYP